jgi:hypothetical protein
LTEAFFDDVCDEVARELRLIAADCNLYRHYELGL